MAAHPTLEKGRRVERDDINRAIANEKTGAGSETRMWSDA